MKRKKSDCCKIPQEFSDESSDYQSSSSNFFIHNDKSSSFFSNWVPDDRNSFQSNDNYNKNSFQEVQYDKDNNKNDNNNNNNKNKQTSSNKINNNDYNQILEYKSTGLTSNINKLNISLLNENNTKNIENRTVENDHTNNVNQFNLLNNNNFISNDYFDNININNVPDSNINNININNFPDSNINNINKNDLPDNNINNININNHPDNNINNININNLPDNNINNTNTNNNNENNKKKSSAHKERDFKIYFIKSFLNNLIGFINELIDIFDKANNTKINHLLAINKEYYVKYGAKDALNFIQKRAIDVLIIDISNIKNGKEEDIKTFNEKLLMITNPNSKYRNDNIISVLNKTIKELMDIYRELKEPEEEYYKFFKRFEAHINSLAKDDEYKKCLRKAGLEYEIYYNHILYNNEHKRGPKAKNN